MPSILEALLEKCKSTKKWMKSETNSVMENILDIKEFVSDFIHFLETNSVMENILDIKDNWDIKWQLIHFTDNVRGHGHFIKKDIAASTTVSGY